MKLMKAEHRASLLPSALESLMMVYLNSLAIKNFDPHSSINEWLIVKSHRISKVDRDSSEEQSDIESIALHAGILLPNAS